MALPGASFGPAKFELSLPDRRVLMHEADGRDIVDVVSDSTNVDAGGPRTTLLRPGNVLLKGSDGIFYDDESSGVVSAGAAVTALEAADTDWASATITVTIDGQALPAVTLGAGDDTTAEVVTALNADPEFRANAVADNNGGSVRIKTLRVGKEVGLHVTSSLATAFGASGTAARGTDGDYVVCLDYVEQLGPLGSAVDAKARAVRKGIFDESNLVFGGAALAANSDAFRVLAARGSRFES